MNGRLGSLHLGKTQIGGIKDWSLDLILTDHSKDLAPEYKLSKWKIDAQSYWLYDVPELVIVRLYPDIGKGYWEGKGRVISTTRKLFDTLINEPIEITGDGILEGRD
jgi:hypothetical protein